jgi:hypothetical protein
MFKEIIETSKWSESHGAEGEFLGAGSLYYFIPYMLKAKKIVCLGSGAGFVPKLMIEAQKALFNEGQLLEVSENIFDVTLIDANIGPWGLPVYNDSIDGYENIKIIKDLTDNVYEQFSDIDYLHVDADHSYEQIYKDLAHYGTRMNPNKRWAITIHDTFNPSDGDHPPIGSYHAAVDWANHNKHDIVNFPYGCGTALIMPKVGL